MPVRDTRMIARALVQRWPIKDEYREAIVKRLVRIVADPNSSPREVIAASKGLMAAEAQNQSDEHNETNAAGNRFFEIAARIAATGGAPRIAAGGETGGGEVIEPATEDGGREAARPDGRVSGDEP